MEVYRGAEPGKNLWKKKKITDSPEKSRNFAPPNSQGGDSFGPSSS
jgi:hypothetical protein